MSLLDYIKSWFVHKIEPQVFTDNKDSYQLILNIEQHDSYDVIHEKDKLIVMANDGTQVSILGTYELPLNANTDSIVATIEDDKITVIIRKTPNYHKISVTQPQSQFDINDVI